MRQYIDKRGNDLEASSFSQENLILEDITKLLNTMDNDITKVK